MTKNDRPNNTAVKTVPEGRPAPHTSGNTIINSLNRPHTNNPQPPKKND